MKAKGWDKALGSAKGTKKYPKESLGWVLWQYRQSATYRKLQPNTKRTYEQAFDRLHKPDLDVAAEQIGGLRRKHVLLIRDKLSDTPAVANSVMAG